ncbi:MAG: DUF3102 domain-containing protein [Phycisphaerae bacterium]
MNLPTPTIIAKLNSLHHEAEQSARQAVDRALQCGELLASVKDRLPHGDFSRFVIDHCRFSLRTAQAYMRLHRHRDELAAKSATVACLGVREALELLAEPKADDTEWGESCRKIDAARAEIRASLAFIDQHPEHVDELLESFNEPMVAAGHSPFTLDDIREIAGVAA